MPFASCRSRARSSRSEHVRKQQLWIKISFAGAAPQQGHVDKQPRFVRIIGVQIGPTWASVKDDFRQRVWRSLGFFKEHYSNATQAPIGTLPDIRSLRLWLAAVQRLEAGCFAQLI